MIIDGKAIAEDMYEHLQKEVSKLQRTPILGIVVVGKDPTIESFVRIKRRAAERLGVEVTRVDLDPESKTADVVAAVQMLAAQSDGLIVQLPMPAHIVTDVVLAAIPPDHDVDAINPTISHSKDSYEAPVALAIAEVLSRTQVEVSNKKTVVVGAGRLVGAPTASLLTRMGADVTVVTQEIGEIAALKEADIVVLGAGDPGFVKPEMLKHGVALIDAGTSESGGKIKGDADPSCADIASVFTPVPGGIGPIAVAMIFKNLFESPALA